MPRPPAKILIETAKDKNNRIDQILFADNIWSVLYDGKPINIRNIHSTVQGSSRLKNIKYKKTNFSNPGPAVNLAKKLNKTFNTDKFTAIKVTGWKKIYPTDVY